jgi:hypothetical protein
MAIGTTAAIIGGSLIGGAASLIGGNKAAKTTKKAAAASLSESQRQFDLTRSDTAMQRQVGDSALTQLQNAFVKGDMSGFRQDPGYQFTMEQGQRAIDNSLIARGRGLSGSAVKAGVDYATGRANQQVGDYFNRLATLAGIGNSGINTSANAGANTASTTASVNMNSAAQRGSSYMSTAGGVNSALQGGISNILLQKYMTPGASGSGSNYALNYRQPTAGYV